MWRREARGAAGPADTTRLRIQLAPSAAKRTARPKAAVPAKVRAALSLRSGGLCEMQLHGCLGPATDSCHRIGRGMGGRNGAAKAASARLSNVLAGCRACHAWTHARPAESYELGLMLHDGQDPAGEPMSYRGQMVYLVDSGEVIDFEGVAA